MEKVLTKALAFVAVIALGYFLKKRGFFKPHDYELIAKIVLNILHCHVPLLPALQLLKWIIRCLY